MRAIVFDVLETLFSLERLRSKILVLGIPDYSLETWFAHTLRDGFALAATGDYQPMKVVARGTLRSLVASHGVKIDEDRVEAALEAMSDLEPHEDVGHAITHLRHASVPMYALSNGSEESTRSLLRKAGFEAFFADVISIDAVKRWKPSVEVYEQAARVANLPIHEMTLIASHPWDVHGAICAGMSAAWIRRGHQLFSPAMRPPEFSADSLPHLCERILHRTQAA